MDCSPQDSFVHGIFQGRMLKWVVIPFSRGIFLTQGSNLGLLHCRQILYCLSQQGRTPPKQTNKQTKTKNQLLIIIYKDIIILDMLHCEKICITRSKKDREVLGTVMRSSECCVWGESQWRRRQSGVGARAWGRSTGPPASPTATASSYSPQPAALCPSQRSRAANAHRF